MFLKLLIEAYGDKRHQSRRQFALLLPVRISLGTQDGITRRSRRGVRTPSRFPNMEDRPRLKSMMKKSTAQT